MIQIKEPKKIKGKRKKDRLELINELQDQYPIWFESKTDKEIIRMISSYKQSEYYIDGRFIEFCISYSD